MSVNDMCKYMFLVNFTSSKGIEVYDFKKLDLQIDSSGYATLRVHFRPNNDYLEIVGFDTVGDENWIKFITEFKKFNNQIREVPSYKLEDNGIVMCNYIVIGNDKENTKLPDNDGKFPVRYILSCNIKAEEMASKQFLHKDHELVIEDIRKLWYISKPSFYINSRGFKIRRYRAEDTLYVEDDSIGWMDI